VSRHRVPQGSGAARRLDDAVKLDQHQIAGLLEDISLEFGISGSMTSVRNARSPAKLSFSSPGNNRLRPATRIAASRRLTRPLASSDTMTVHL